MSRGVRRIQTARTYVAMIQIIVGKRNEAFEKKLSAVLGGFGSVTIERRDATSPSFEFFYDDVHTPSLFGDKVVYVISGVFDSDERKQEFIERGPALAHAPHEVVVLADAILAADLKKVQSFVTVHAVTEKARKEPAMNPFALANAFASGDKKKTWLLFQEVMANDDEVEKTHGMIWWKLKDMIQKKSAFNPEQLKAMARSLVAVYHEARLGSGLDMKERLEQFFLTMPDLKK